MMKKKAFYWAFSLFAVSLISCNQEIDEPIKNLELYVAQGTRSLNIVKKDTLVQNYEFLYKGKAYETSLLVVDDSIVSVGNKEVEGLFSSLNVLPDLVTYIHRNGEIEYFDNRAELLLVLPSIVKNEENDVVLSEKISNGIVDNPACDPIMNGYYANLFLCDDRNYGGKVRHVLLSTANRDTVVNHLKPDYDMNDKTTAFCAYSFGGNTLFELYENDHLKSHCLSFTCYSKDAQVMNGPYSTSFQWLPYGAVIAPNLRNVHVEGTKSSSWNDRITSVKITRL